MLNTQPYYHQTLRRVLITFGSLFKNIQMVTYAKDTRQELRRITVPLTFEGKESYMTRLLQDPQLQKGVQTVLPSMSYEMKTLKYDPTRKLSPFEYNQICGISNSTAQKVLLGKPFILGIELNLYIRDTEDGFNIIEQILPSFTPSYTVNMNYVTSGTANCTISNDVPFTIMDTEYSNSYQGESASVRYLNWVLTFDANILLYGAITNPSAVIRESISNIYDLDSNSHITMIDVQPNPNTANSTDNYSYTTVITENVK